MKWQSQICLRIIIFFLILTLAQMAGGFVYAAEAEILPPNRFFTINLDEQTAAKGYTVSAFDGAAKLILKPGDISGPTAALITELNETIDVPWQLEKLSKVYQFEIKNKAAFDGKKPINLQLAYSQPSDCYKQIYYFDKNYSSWRPLPTVDNPQKSIARATINLPFARVAVFANPEALVMGQASWYVHKGGMFAASPDFPKDSRLRVFNTANNKFVDVVVNDFGPDRQLLPGRVIDLDKKAFKKIAPTGAGVINVRVLPLVIMPENNKILGVATIGVATQFNITAKSAVVMDEQSGKILWQKNATSTLPLASLTKLVAVQVFLDCRPTLNQIVAYSAKDEEYNYQYAAKAETARLKLKDGDTLLVGDLLYAALVGSANNAVESLVRVSGLPRDEFIATMNQTAANWGATSTHFVEPTGLSPENVSSALDYAIISRAVYINPIIQKASIMKQYKFTTLNTNQAHTINNTDQLLTVSGLNITGSKTGFLDEAQYCLMVRAKNNSGRQVITVTMGVDSRQNSFEQTELLTRYGLKVLDNKI